MGNSFLLYKDQWDFIQEYYSKHREVPPVDVFETKFEDWDFYNTDGAIEFYIEEIHKWKAQHVVQEIITGAAGSLRDIGPFTTINRMQQALAKLGRDTRMVRDVDLIGNVDERIENLRERVALRESGRTIIGVPTGIKAFDEAFGGAQKGDFIVIAGWTGSLKCADEDTLVVRGDGSFAKIKDIRAGDTVVSFNMNEAVPQKVVNAMYQGEQECYEVTLNSGKKITITANHPLHTPDGWRPLEDIEVGEFISAPNSLPEPNEGPYTVPFMRLLGMLCGDGNITKSTEISITNMDEDVWRVAEECMAFMGSGLGEIQQKKDNSAWSRPLLDPKGYFRDALREVGVMDFECADRPFPSIMNASNEQLASFIGGLWDTDGSVGSNIRITLSNEDFARSLQIALMRFGVHSKVTHIPTNGGWNLAIRDASSILNFFYNIRLATRGKESALCDLVYKELDSQNSRSFPVTENVSKLLNGYTYPKDSKASHIVESSKLSGSITFGQAEELLDSNKSTELAMMLSIDLFWDKIVSIDPVGIRHTYDLEMEGEPNFVANGINIHNSWLALYIAQNAWLEGYRVLYISLEMSALQIGYRFDTLLSGRTGNKFSNSGLTHAQDITFDSYKNWLGDVTRDKHPFIVVTNEDLDEVTQNTVSAKIDQWKPDLVVLDYHGLFDDASGATGETEKAQPLDAKILTPNGWKLMGDIKVGDDVIGSDGNPTEVTGISPQGTKPIYRVSMSDGSSTESCGEHLWAVNTETRSFRGDPHLVKTLDSIREDLKTGGGDIKWSIPISAEIQFEEQEVPLDPYLLGLLLGGGSFVGRSLHFSTSDSDIITYIEDALPEGNSVIKKSELNTYGYSITDKDDSSVISAIRSLGLWEKSRELKFVPDIYLYNSTEVRREILSGLLDSDGCTSSDVTTFTSPSRDLAEGVQNLVSSLGGTATITMRETASLPSWNVSIKLESNPFKLERKRSIWSKSSKDKPYRGIKSIEYVGEKKAQCIRVDNPDGLYVTDDYIVTHNTKNLSKAFKRIAIKTQVPIIDITGVTMSGDHGERPPELAEMAWSKQLAYDSDLTLSLLWKNDVLEVVSRKTRRGKEFRFWLDWNVDKGIVTERSKAQSVFEKELEGSDDSEWIS